MSATILKEGIIAVMPDGNVEVRDFHVDLSDGNAEEFMRIVETRVLQAAELIQYHRRLRDDA
jgi:hypothetical protein